jgi:penicillin-binding protein 1A
MRILNSLIATLFLLVAIGGFAAYGVYQHFSGDLPDFDQLKNYQPLTVSRVQAGDGRLMAEYATQKRVFVPVSAMPPRLIEAVLAAEDREFFSHGGVNFEAILRAAVTNLLHAGSGRRQIGASTITQQVAKNFLLGNEYSYTRKIKEILLAMRMEQVLSKQRILELYLNEIYFGQGAYGVAEAALTYFNASLDQLTTAQCAFLASLPKGPNNYDPVRHYAAAKERRDWVLDGMFRIGAITEAEMKAAQAEPITLVKRSDSEVYDAPYFTAEVRRELLARFGEKMVYEGGLSVRTSLDPTYQTMADTALREGLVAYDRRHGYRGPVAHIEDDDSWLRRLVDVPVPAGAAPWKMAVVRVVKANGVTLGLADGSPGWLPMSELSWARPELKDQRVGPTPRRPSDVLQAGDVILVEPVQAETVAEQPVKPKRRKGKGKQAPLAEAAAVKPATETVQFYGLRQIPEVSGAIVVLDPRNGRVYAMTGGYSYQMSQFNRVTQAYRQTGSAIKPIVYLAALDNGMTPSTLISGAPVAIEQGPGLPLWRPSNFDASDNINQAPLRVAIEKSINTMTVRMASTIGIDKIIPYVLKLGIMDTMPPEYSYVLGAGLTTPLRLTTAYGMLVNGGKQITPSVIDRVQDRNGVTIFKHDMRACPRCGDYDWPAPGEVPDLPDDRAQVLDPATAFQMVNILRGVVERGTAAHAVGYLNLPLAGKTGTSNDAKDTWFVGFSPDLVAGVYVGFDQPRTLGPREQGASVAAPIFADFMGAALKDKPLDDFRIPPGVVMVRVDPSTGLPTSADNKYIWEAFKPGTEPLPAGEGGAQQVVEGGQGIETLPDDTTLPASDAPTDAAAPGDATLDTGASSPGTPVPPGQLPAPAPTPDETTIPSTGTGGLY